MVFTELLGLFVRFGYILRITLFGIYGCKVKCLTELTAVVQIWFHVFTLQFLVAANPEVIIFGIYRFDRFGLLLEVLVVKIFGQQESWANYFTNRMADVVDFGLAAFGYLPAFNGVLILHHNQFIFTLHQLRITYNWKGLNSLNEPLPDWILSASQDVVLKNIRDLVLLIHLLYLHILILIFVLDALQEPIPVEIIGDGSFFQLVGVVEL